MEIMHTYVRVLRKKEVVLTDKIIGINVSLI